MVIGWLLVNWLVGVGEVLLIVPVGRTLLRIYLEEINARMIITAAAMDKLRRVIWGGYY